MYFTHTKLVKATHAGTSPHEAFGCSVWITHDISSLGFTHKKKRKKIQKKKTHLLHTEISLIFYVLHFFMLLSLSAVSFIFWRGETPDLHKKTRSEVDSANASRTQALTLQRKINFLLCFIGVPKRVRLSHLPPPKKKEN